MRWFLQLPQILLFSLLFSIVLTHGREELKTHCFHGPSQSIAAQDVWVPEIQSMDQAVKFSSTFWYEMEGFKYGNWLRLTPYLMLLLSFFLSPDCPSSPQKDVTLFLIVPCLFIFQVHHWPQIILSLTPMLEYKPLHC